MWEVGEFVISPAACSLSAPGNDWPNALADQVWELWEQTEIDDQVAIFAWLSLRDSDHYRV